MATNAELKAKWEPVTKYQDNFMHAIATVFAEEGVQVPLVRMFSHCMIESHGDPQALSGPNKCCSDYGPYTPGVECSPDCKAHGLFQIYWPICGTTTDWNKVHQINYNSYLGAKYLACAYKQCDRSWRKASRKFFTGNCNPTGTVDPNTGTSEDKYDSVMTTNMQELAQIGFDKDPELPKVTNPPTNGTPNTSDGGCKTDEDCCKDSLVGRQCQKCVNGHCECRGINIFGLCLQGSSSLPIPGTDNSAPVDDPITGILAQLSNTWLPRIAVIIVGVILLAIGAITLLDSGTSFARPF